MFLTNVGIALAMGGVAVNAVAFNGPIATPIMNRFADSDGWTPLPTTIPRSLPELFRRQSDPGMCGYIIGDPESPISCDVGSCVYNADLKWFGCCAGTASSDCDLQTACVESKSVSQCQQDQACANDKQALLCTESSAPACATFRTESAGKTYSHWVCGASATRLDLFASVGLRPEGKGDEKSNTVDSMILRLGYDDVTSSSNSGDSSTTAATGSSSKTNGLAAAAVTSVTSGVVVAVTSSTGGAAPLKTAEALLGAAAGMLALLV